MISSPHLALALAVLVASCGQRGGRSDEVSVPGAAGATKSTASVRAERRAYNGAPPTIPHTTLGAACSECHNADGIAVEKLGFAPPSPHSASDARFIRCLQCHVRSDPAKRVKPIAASRFAGLRQGLRRGTRAHPLAPPRMPHAALLRENCLACHWGPAAREEIRTPHPERVRCRQCHVPVETNQLFARDAKDL